MVARAPNTETTVKSSNKKEESLMFHVQKGDLYKGIQLVQSAISSRSTLPVLGNILFEAEDNLLRLSATDLEVGIRTSVKADVLQNGAMTIPAKILSDFLKTLEDEREVKFTLKENNKVEIKSGRDRLNVTGLPRADYPVLPEFDPKNASVIPANALSELIRKTIYAASTDETRYVLNGIHFVIEDSQATAVATDGRRLAFIQRPINDKDLKAKVIVPSKAIHELARILGDAKEKEAVSVTFGENQVSFSFGNSIVLSRLIEGHFPNFEQVIPKSHEIQINLKKNELQASVSRAAVGTLERGGSIRLKLAKGVLQILGSAQGRVEAQSEIAVNYEGANFEIAFNPIYMIDVLKSLDQDDIYLELTSPLNPGVIRPSGDDSHRYIMMPMKV